MGIHRHLQRHFNRRKRLRQLQSKICPTNGGPAKPSIEDYSASDGLVGFDRHTGERLWTVPANHSFLHNGIVAGDGRIYCLDKLPKSAEDKLKRCGAAIPRDYRIVTIDSRTGKKLWEHKNHIFGNLVKLLD